MRISSKNGFTLIEVLTAVMILSVIVFLALSYYSTNTQNAGMDRYVSTKNRVLATIRDSASMPAALRASMMAAYNGAYVNPMLMACAGGDPSGSCKSGVEVPFTLYSPLVGWDPTTQTIVGVQAISAPLNTQNPLQNPLRVNSFGTTCTTPGPDCSLMIFTSMIPQCGPAVQPAPTPAPSASEMAPQATCTFADVIQVNYWVQVDTSVADSSMISALGTVSGSVTVSVQAISGNVPQ